MNLNVIFLILFSIKTVRNIQNSEEKTHSDSDQDDQSVDSFYTRVFGIKKISKKNDDSYGQNRKTQKNKKHIDTQDNYNGNNGLYSTLNYTGYSNRYNSYFDPSDPENPYSAYKTRGDADYNYNLAELFKSRGDVEFEDYEHLLMQGDDPNAYDAQNGVSKDGKPNVAVVSQPKEENTHNDVSEEPEDGKNIEQPLAENESNKSIRDHQSTPQVFTRIFDGKTQGDDQKSQHSIAGSYIPLEKLRMRKRLTFTCSRCIPVINIDFV